MAEQGPKADKTAARPRRNAARPRRVPQRTCIGCRTVLPKRQLVRLVRQPNGGVEIDASGKAAGRGAYLHERRACWKSALSSRGLDQALKTTLTEADRARLRAIGEQYQNDDV